jgi:hypothetical protein
MTSKQIISWLLKGNVSILYQTNRDLLDTNKSALRKKFAFLFIADSNKINRNMKSLFTFLMFFCLSISSIAQESMATVMEKRAREMYRVINLSDKQEWITFIKENYTQALIDKQQTMKVHGNENGQVTSTTMEMNEADKLEGKAKMFARLHEDFNGSKIVSIKSKEENLEMVLDNGDGLIGTFKLKFVKNTPYLIEALGIQAGN